jgi:hypothetical protein
MNKYTFLFYSLILIKFSLSDDFDFYNMIESFYDYLPTIVKGYELDKGKCGDVFINEKQKILLIIKEVLDQIKKITYQMEKSVCKINNNKGAINTGFFCIIPLIKEKKYLPVLITNKHILDEEDLLPGKKIYCRMNDDKLDFSINMDKTRKIFIDEGHDYD